MAEENDVGPSGIATAITIDSAPLPPQWSMFSCVRVVTYQLPNATSLPDVHSGTKMRDNNTRTLCPPHHFFYPCSLRLDACFLPTLPRSFGGPRSFHVMSSSSPLLSLLLYVCLVCRATRHGAPPLG